MNGLQDKIKNEPKWMAVYAISLGVAGLITSEFLPVSILTPIARDLQVSEGAAGQSISVTALIALFSSLFIGILTRKIDRRWVLLSFSVLQVVSNLLVAFAPTFFILMVGRVLLGVAVGGFWAMSIPITMRLVPEKLVSKALAVIFSAVSIATVLSAPLGSFLDGLIGWRNVFLLVAAIGVAAFVWQFFTLPSMPPTSPPRLKSLVGILKRRPVRWGMFANMFAFVGYSVFFTYLRPFLENVTQVSVNILSVILLVYGIANLIGAISAKFLLEKNFLLTLTLAPLTMGVLTILLVFLGSDLIFASLLIALWGFAFGSVQVGWPTWVTKAVSDEAESAGSLIVAFTQIAITLGAGIGGLVYDRGGINITFELGGLILFIAALVALSALKGIKWNEITTGNDKL
jgi:predicted MFS family arabinose efflux permease